MNVYPSLLFSLIFLFPGFAHAGAVHTPHLVFGLGVMVVLTLALYVLKEAWQFYKSHQHKPVIKKRKLLSSGIQH